ncbi:hypothetical protein MNBD_GAMMA22-2597 [hydrothermal vent metagenome]|uniref:DUF4124 domain-containing protein n=1 Tax=hydrothermal vent metagenome TaxID=652676 RepID=A0A3B1AJU7_9ZZZZ
MNYFIKSVVFFGLNVFIVSVVMADIYQWRDSSGGLQFGNNPPKGNTTVTVISTQPTTLKQSSDTDDPQSEVTPATNKLDAKVSKSSMFKNSRRTKLLYLDKVINKKSRIISVRLLKENKSTLVFDVNYYLSEKIYGAANIGIIPNMDNYSSVFTKAHPGRHATTITIKLSNSSKSIVRSTELKLSMALAKEKGFVGSLFEHKLPFNKVWYKK